MGSLEEILERVQYKFASIIGELCGEPLALSQFAIWVDMRLAEYKLKGSISLDCTGKKIDPDWLRSLNTIQADTSGPSAQTSPSPAPRASPPKHYSPVSSSTNPSVVHHVPPHTPFPPRGHNTPILPVPPQAHSGNPPYSHIVTPLTNTTPPNPVPRLDADNRKRSASPDVVIVKTEPVDDGFETPAAATKSQFLDGTCNPAVQPTTTNVAAVEGEQPMSPSKLPRLHDGPPPLKSIIDDPSGEIVTSCCGGNSKFIDASENGAFPPDLNRECVENDVDLMASTSGSGSSSDIPEDLSTPRFHLASWNSQSETERNSRTMSVLQPFGEFSCLRNGPRFSQQWHQFVTNRSINLKSMSSERYRGYMDLLKVAQSKVHVPKSVKEHKMLYKFDLWRDGASERLIKKRHKDTDPVRFYIPDDQLFHALLAVHLDSGHGGIKKMLTLCKERYANITADAVKLFTHLCYDCQTRKRTMPPKHRDSS